MTGHVTIEKTFDEAKAFSKELENGDFETFFKEEGEYLDKLVGIMKEKGESGDEFTVTYTVTVKR